jgi:vancomycin resistance protein VanJ
MRGARHGDGTEAVGHPMTASSFRTPVARLALAAVTSVAAVELLLAILRPEAGPLGVIEIFAPHLAVIGCGLVPLTLLRRSRLGTVAIASLVVVAGIRFGGDWLSLPRSFAASDADRLEVATWNLEVQSRPGATTAATLRGLTTDVIAVQELQSDVADAIMADADLAARYPYRILRPRADVLGLGLLSRYPILDATFRVDPAVLEARLQLGPGNQVVVIDAHPLHADLASFGGTRLPVGLDVDQRNADLATIRSTIDTAMAAGFPVVLLGDLNTAASEPAHDRFVAGLRDAHAEVGQGPGWTWRPIRLEFLGVGVIRIDYVIVSPSIEPLAIGEMCPPIGDHCLVQAELGIAPGAGSAGSAPTH